MQHAIDAKADHALLAARRPIPHLPLLRPPPHLRTPSTQLLPRPPPLAPGSGYTGTKYWRGVAVLYVTCIAHSYAVASVMSYVGFYAVAHRAAPSHPTSRALET